MRKFLLFSGLFIVFFVVLIVVLFISPPIHKAAFLWAVEDKVDAITVEKVRFTGSSFKVEGLSVAHQGTEFTADVAEVRASWLQVAQSQELHIDEILVHGLVADLATVAGASGGGLGAWLDLFGGEDTAESEPFRGILNEMKASEAISVARLRLDARVLLPTSQSVDLNLAVDDLTFGKTSRVRVQGAFLDASGNGPVDRATYDLSLDLEQNSLGEMRALSGTVGVQMIGETLNEKGQVDISGLWELALTEAGEKLTLRLNEADRIAPLIDAALLLVAETGALSGDMALNLNGSLIPVSMLELPPAVGSAVITSEGDLTWNVHTGVGSFDLRGSGLLEQKPWEYTIRGSGSTHEIPAVVGFLKTGFSDDAGVGTLTMNFNVNSSGNRLVSVPVEVAREERLTKMTLTSDLDSLSLNPFQVILKGETVHLADLQSVATALGAWGYSMQQVDIITDEGATVDDLPVSPIPWDGMKGRATVAIDRLMLPQGYVLEDLSSEISVRGDSVSVSAFETHLDKGTIKGNGDLIYSEGSENPFTFRAEGILRNIPSGLVDLGSGAPITGSWNGRVSAIGQTHLLDQLADSMQVSLSMEGSAGVLQLTRVNERANQTAQLLNLGLSLFGGQDGRLGAVSQMTQYLQRVPYNAIRIDVERFPNGQVSIKDFTVQGPELLLSGNGSINAQNWKTLAQGALSMNLSMGTKGSFGESAQALGLTSQNLTGDYLLWKKPINISGTLSNPNYSALSEIIQRAIR